MKTWDDWSDGDINRAMTCIVYNCQGWELTQNGNGYYHCGVDYGGYYVQYIVDFCNSPEEMWPIVVDNGISVMYSGDGVWNSFVSNEHDDLVADVYHTNPLRAAAIVFLIMNGVKPE